MHLVTMTITLEAHGYKISSLCTLANVFFAQRLTAFVARTLCQAHAVEGITIDPMVIDDALKWLVTKQNRVTGQFEETGRVIHQEMTVFDAKLESANLFEIDFQGGVSSASSCSLTAFILISMLECSYGNTQVFLPALAPRIHLLTFDVLYRLGKLLRGRLLITLRRAFDAKSPVAVHSLNH